MRSAIALRTDFTGSELRQLARCTRDAINSPRGAAIVYQMAILLPHHRASPGGRDDHRWWRSAGIWRRIAHASALPRAVEDRSRRVRHAR